MDLEWLRAHASSVTSNRAEAIPAPAAPVNRELSALEQQEYELIARTLADENGGIRRAATKLGLTHQALLRRLQKWPELRQVTGPPE
jgi:DNA-binding NtrC family response regulator